MLRLKATQIHININRKLYGSWDNAFAAFFSSKTNTYSYEVICVINYLQKVGCVFRFLINNLENFSSIQRCSQSPSPVVAGKAAQPARLDLKGQKRVNSGKHIGQNWTSPQKKRSKSSLPVCTPINSPESQGRAPETTLGHPRSVSTRHCERSQVPVLES